MSDSVPPVALARAVNQHATVLPTMDDEISDIDLAAFDEVIGDARVVALGESTHFVDEFGTAQRRLVRYLAERHGFTVLAHEFGFAEGRTLDRWLHGHGEADDLVLHRDVPGARCDATMDRWRWLRDHNAAGVHPLRFVGLDTPAGGGSLRPLLTPLAAFLERADPDAVPWVRTVEDIAYRFEALSQAGAAPLWAQVPIADRSLLTALLARLSLRMDALRPVYRERTSTAEVDLARRHLDIAVVSDHMVAAIHDLFSGAGLTMDTSIRDRLMADSLFWHLDRIDSEDRVVLLAHNLHIQKTGIDEGVSSALTMGSYLSDTLGGAYRSIALTHTARRAPTISMTTDDPHGFIVTDGPVDEPPSTGVEGAITAAGLDSVTSLLPLGPLRGNSPLTALRTLGAQGSHLPTDVLAAFDAVINVPIATMTRHTSLY